MYSPWNSTQCYVTSWMGGGFGENGYMYGGKEPPANAGDLGDASSIPGLGRSPGGGHENCFSILAWRIPNPMDRGACQAIVHRVTQSEATYHGTAWRVPRL